MMAHFLAFLCESQLKADQGASVAFACAGLWRFSLCPLGLTAVALTKKCQGSRGGWMNGRMDERVAITMHE